MQEISIGIENEEKENKPSNKISDKRDTYSFLHSLGVFLIAVKWVCN